MFLLMIHLREFPFNQVEFVFDLCFDREDYLFTITLKESFTDHGIKGDHFLIVALKESFYL